MGGCYTLGLDFGTGSLRGILVNIANGEAISESVHSFSQGLNGVITSPSNPNLARQHPADYIEALKAVAGALLSEARDLPGFKTEQIIGIGVDTTGSSPLPVDKEGLALAFHEDFMDDPDALVWLWKDHSAHAEAISITETARKHYPEYLNKIGGTYSSEWFWAKIWHCAQVNARVYEAAYTWVEHADWISALLTGTLNPQKLKRGICAAGHKAMYHQDWGGYPEPAFLNLLDPRLVELRKTLPDKTHNSGEIAGFLSSEWAENLGLPAGIPVAVGAFDAHLGAVGAGITEGILVKNIGTSCCDMFTAPMRADFPDIPGLCGIVPESILPGFLGLEAGQSAVGDIFNWFANVISADEENAALLNRLEPEAAKIAPGESGLLALDWQNGNRTILVDQRLTGLFIGLTLHTSPAELYRALIEATAFGARVILNRFEEFGVKIKRIIACGGIPYKNSLLMQIYADILDRPIELSRSEQTAALGSAIAGALAAGSERGGYADFSSAISAMTGTADRSYKPNREHRQVYDDLYGLYKELHDSFGVEGKNPDLYRTMKRLLEIKDQRNH